MDNMLKLGTRYLNLDALAAVRLTPTSALVTLLGGNVVDIPLGDATDLLTWCDAMATHTHDALFGRAPEEPPDAPEAAA